MILAIQQNLERGMNLLYNISDSDYSDASVAPYYSSIGIHMRHVLDVFQCVFNGLSDNEINLIKRSRNELVENNRSEGIEYFEKTIAQLKSLEGADLKSMIVVTDDLGNGPIDTHYTIGAILAQAHSHAIHHFASIGYVITQLEIDLPDDMFGFNPTTPRTFSLK